MSGPEPSPLIACARFSCREESPQAQVAWEANSLERRLPREPKTSQRREVVIAAPATQRASRTKLRAHMPNRPRSAHLDQRRRGGEQAIPVAGGCSQSRHNHARPLRSWDTTSSPVGSPPAPWPSCAPSARSLRPSFPARRSSPAATRDQRRPARNFIASAVLVVRRLRATTSTAC